MNHLKVFLIFALSIMTLKANAHGSLPMPSCWGGGDFFVNSPYSCKITFTDPQPTDDFYHGQKKTFQFRDILLNNHSQWTVKSGASAVYTTSQETRIILAAFVSCPLPEQEVDLNVIDINLWIDNEKTGEHRDFDLSDVSISKGRTMRTSFSIDDHLAEISCTH